MKYSKLITALMLSATMAGTAIAQNAPVEIYGNLNVAGVAHKGPGLDAFNMHSSVLGNSVLGFRSKYDVGSGFTTRINLETAVNTNNGNVGSSLSGVGSTNPGTGYIASSGSSTMFYRKANVELGVPSAGTFTIGRQLTPHFAQSAQISALGIASGGILQAAGLFSSFGATGNKLLSGTTSPLNPDLNVSTTIGGPGYYSNGIGWKSPTMSGFTVNALWSLNQSSPSASNSFDQQGQKNIVVDYTNGPFFALAGRQLLNDNVGNELMTSNMAGLGYTAGKLTTKLGYYDAKFGRCSETKSGGNCMTSAMGISAAGVISPAVNAASGTRYGADFKATEIGTSYQINDRSRVAAAYTLVNDEITAANKVKFTSVYGEYDLSKNTRLFALASRADNSGLASASPIFGMPAKTSATGQSVDTVALGMRVLF